MKSQRASSRLDQNRPTFFLLGLCITLLGVYGLLNLKSEITASVPTCGSTQSNDDTFVVPQTIRKTPQPDKKKLDPKKANKKMLSDIFIEVPDNAIIAPLEDEGEIFMIDETLGKEVPVLTVDIYSLDKKPVFPGCENILDEKERFECFKAKMSAFVVANFKPCESAFGIDKEHIYVSFVIDEFGRAGKVEVARAQNQCNEKNAVQLIDKLPAMKPGMYLDKKVKTRFVLPINIK